MLVKLYKYEGEATTDGGIILEDFEYMQTESGQVKARLNGNQFQLRGRVVLVGDLPDGSFYQKIKPGVTVLTSTNKLEPFKVDRTKRGEVNNGYFLVNFSTIEAIQNV